MAYDIKVSNRVIKTLRKIKDKNLKTLITNKLYNDIANDPHNGDLKIGDLANIFTVTVKDKKVEYRIAYTINEDVIQVDIVHVGTRENFYQDLRKIISG